MDTKTMKRRLVGLLVTTLLMGTVMFSMISSVQAGGCTCDCTVYPAVGGHWVKVPTKIYVTNPTWGYFFWWHHEIEGIDDIGYYYWGTKDVFMTAEEYLDYVQLL